MKSKLIIIFLLTVLLLGLVGTASALSLAIMAPFAPHQGLFGIQNWAEHRYQALLHSPESRAQFALRLFERRIQDLEQALGTPAESNAFLMVSNEIVHILDLFRENPLENETEFRAFFVNDLNSLLALLDSLDSMQETHPNIFIQFKTEVVELKNNVENDGVSLETLTFNGALKEIPVSSTRKDSTTVLVLANMESQIIPFPPGSSGAKHLFYPLDGKHSELNCFSCHRDGNYSGTPNLCIDCHSNAKPVGHFTGQCEVCHSTSGWLPSTFSHQLGIAVDCQNCHLNVVPENHYQGQCSACHSTTSWLPATFDHQTIGAMFCDNCHAGNQPANHYTAQCSACHTTTAWLPANFDHQAAGAVDCGSCHNTQKPANHYAGQCSACHSTNAWLPAGFNHQVAGAADCQACHLNERPANHFSGQCSDCHSTSGWTPASYSHTFPTNHGGAGGVCQECHTSGDRSWTCFTCHNQSEMDHKHNEEGIANYAVRCLECHANGKEND